MTFEFFLSLLMFDECVSPFECDNIGNGKQMVANNFRYAIAEWSFGLFFCPSVK